MTNALSLSTFAAADTDYVAKLNADARATESAVNTLFELVENTFGDGALLISDLFLYDGIIGDESFVLDVPAYTGGGQITVGRRPVAPVFAGETSESAAWLTVSGRRTRIVVSVDTELDADAILEGIPKTIYVVVTSGGDVQLEEEADVANELYLYSMTWNGFSLSDFVRMAPILPGYQLLKRIAAPMLPIQLYDPDTNFVDDVESVTMLTIPGAPDESGPLAIPGGFEVLGGFVSFNKAGLDGAYAPGATGADSKLVLEVRSDDVVWNVEEDLEVNVNLAPNTQYWRVDESVVGLDRFCNEYREFRLVRASIGSGVISARAFTWGLYVRPIIGAAVGKDTDKLDMI